MVDDNIPSIMRVSGGLGGSDRWNQRRLPLGSAQIGHLTLGMIALLVASGTFAAEFGAVVTTLRSFYLLSGTLVVFGWLLAWLVFWLVLEVAWSVAVAGE